MIFLFLNKSICCHPSIESSQRDGSHDGQQNMFVCRMWLIVPKLSLSALLIWSTGKMGCYMAVKMSRLNSVCGLSGLSIEND